MMGRHMPGFPGRGNASGLAFPCNAEGHVDMDSLSERGRSNYLFARAMIGREFATPNVRLS